MAATLIPPSPPTSGPLGHMKQFNTDTLSFMQELRDLGDFTSFRFGPFLAYSANGPDVVHQILVTDADKFHKSRSTKLILRPVIGMGLFTNDGDAWRRQRRLTQPAFHTKRIGAYGDIMVKHTLRLLESWRPGTARAIPHDMAQLTMGIIAETLFDAQVGEEADAISRAVTEVLKTVDVRFNRLIPTPEWLPIPENRRFHAAIRELDVLIQRFIDERRRSQDDRGDLLSMLLLARDEDDGGLMTDQEVRDEAMTLFGAGHETTSNALMWTWYCLSENPAVEAKLHAELDEVLAGRTPTLDDLPRLKYTEMVIKEALRLYPPAWGTSRDAIADVTIAGYPVRRGSTIMINIFGLHRDARYFPDPLRFDPERFSPENEKAVPKYAYLPFGGGPRVCIGNAFAMMEAKLVLATIASRWKLRVAPGQQVQPERVFTLRARYGLDMIVQPRQPDTTPAAALAEPV